MQDWLALACDECGQLEELPPGVYGGWRCRCGSVDISAPFEVDERGNVTTLGVGRCIRRVVLIVDIPMWKALVYVGALILIEIAALIAVALWGASQ